MLTWKMLDEALDLGIDDDNVTSTNFDKVQHLFMFLEILFELKAPNDE